MLEEFEPRQRAAQPRQAQSSPPQFGPQLCGRSPSGGVETARNALEVGH